MAEVKRSTKEKHEKTQEHVKWPGVWRRKEWAGEGKKKRKEREKKEREKSKANHGKDWQHIAKENQPSKFIPFYQQTKGVFIWDNKYNKCGIDKKQNRMKDKNTQEKGCGGEIKSQINVTEHRIN